MPRSLTYRIFFDTIPSMVMDLMFFINSIGFGVGLAMDAFSVSLANGLNEPDMKPSRSCLIAGVFAGFQIAMPLIGWICVHLIASAFEAFTKFIPWIALILLLYIGGKMLFDGIKGSDEETQQSSKLGLGALMVQGIATSIDALSVGFTMAEYNTAAALVESLIIGVVTYAICIAGIKLGKKFGTRLAGKATILGGVILIAIGIEIFVKGMI